MLQRHGPQWQGEGMRMNPKRARRRFGLMAGLSVILGIAFFMFLYLPQSDELRAKEAEAFRIRKELAETAAFRRSHPDSAEEEKTVAARRRLFEEKLPARLDQGAFLLEAERRAAETGVRLLGVVPGDGSETGGWAKAPVRLAVSGDYFSLLDFLYSIEQRGRFVKIDAVRGKNDGGVFTGTVELWIYARAL